MKIALLSNFFSALSHQELGKLWYFLGIEVARSKIGINFSQRKYVLDILEETGLLGVRLVDTPMDSNYKRVRQDRVLFSYPSNYHRLVGKLNYLNITRCDVSYVVSVVS
jgi:hypothetical protein